MSWWMAASCAPAGRNWLWSWKKKDTAGSRPTPGKPRPRRPKEAQVTTAIKNPGTYLDIFPAFEKRAVGHNVAWLRELRAQAFARFCETGFPTTHDEDWRFTNVSAIARTPFQLAPAAVAPLSKSELEAS